jgi:catechol 2,3-dioxygenase-like lactoylglutathione lyase family enzyme
MFEYTFDHAHVYCTDVPASERFFVDVLAARVTERRGTTVVLDFGGGSVLLRPQLAGETLGPAGSPRFGIDHLGIRVADVPAAVAELRERGGEISGPPRELRPGVFVAFVQGPDNVRVELLSRARQEGNS